VKQKQVAEQLRENRLLAFSPLGPYREDCRAAL